MTSLDARAQLGRWSGRALFFVSVLALLATSPKRWEVTATIDGPKRAPSHRGLELAIDATSEPDIVIAGADGGGLKAPCLARWILGTRLSCFVPPDAVLTAVKISGVCPGFVCTGDCPPPASVKVTTTETEAWSDVLTSTLTATLPPHDLQHPETYFAESRVVVEGARFIKVKLEVTATGSSAPFFSKEQACELEPAGAGGLAACTFSVPCAKVAPGTNVDVVAEAKGWGTSCVNDVHVPCASPKTLRIDSMGFESHP
jgi:hypothetical protein